MVRIDFNNLYNSLCLSMLGRNIPGEGYIQGFFQFEFPNLLAPSKLSAVLITF